MLQIDRYIMQKISQKKRRRSGQAGERDAGAWRALQIGDVDASWANRRAARRDAAHSGAA